ncbi:MAG: LysR family transcriptional regulator [Chlorobiaceae bacterium]|nr:LysR family transcriptional regulator [Chlorobiaceae bacterium]
MLDYRLTVFDAVARRRSFTKAAEELCITQPAVTRHIKELEKQFRARLFERQGNRIALTGAGLVMQRHVMNMQELSRQLEQEIDLLNETRRGSLKLGASTTIAQYVLPPVLAKFHKASRDVRLTLLNANTEQIEQSLLAGEIELGLIEGDSRRREIRYIPFAIDEIVLVSGAANVTASKSRIGLEKLRALPLIMREAGSGTLEVLTHELKNRNMKLSDLSIEMSLGSTEAIKSYLMHSDCMAFISRHAVAREIESGILKIVEIDDFAIHRQFSFIVLQGSVGGLADYFMRFAGRQYAPLPACPA